MDPYLKVFIGAYQYQTYTKEDAGSAPKFDQTFAVELETGEENLEIKAFDKNSIGSDDLIGMFNIPIRKFEFNGEKISQPVIYKDQEVGFIHFDIKTKDQPYMPEGQQ